MQIRNLAGLVLATGACLAAPAWAEDAATAAPPATVADTVAPPPPVEGSAAVPAAPTAPAAPAAEGAPAAPPAAAVENAPAATAAPMAPATAIVPVEPIFTGGPKQFQETLGGFVDKEADVVYLPAMQLHWIVRNKFTASGGVMRKHKSSKEIVAPADRVVLERVLGTLQDDLAARFEAAGWDARTRAELGSDVPELKGLAPKAELGYAVLGTNNGIYDQDWAAFALPGAQPVDPKSIGNGMAWNRYVRAGGKSGFNLNITYQFGAGTVGETASRQLGTQVDPGLWFGARADIIGASSGGYGSIALSPEGLVVDPSVGTFAEIEGSKSGTTENVVRFMAGMGGRDRAGFAMTPDWAKAEAAMLRAGRAFNAELVKRLTAAAD